MDINIPLEWLIGVLGTLSVSSFGVGYKYCKGQKEPTIERKEFSCDIVHNEWVESMTYSGYPVILTGYKKAVASLRDGVPYWVECRHFSADGIMCMYTNKPCLLKNQLTSSQSKN